MSNRFSSVKNIFLEDGCKYIDISPFIYEKLMKSLQKPQGITLFYGVHGAGKTFLLKKIDEDLSLKSIFFPQPYFNESSFLTSLDSRIFPEDRHIKIDNFEKFLELYREKTSHLKEKKVVTILLDDAQLYPIGLIKKIRLLADTGTMRFLFAVNKKNDIFTKDYFATRIWESVEMPSPSLDDIRGYLEKKLQLHDRLEFFSLLSSSHIKLIFKLTNGNLRVLNKLMYNFFEICEYYEANNFSLTNKTKYIQLSAIKMELINA